MVARIVEEYVSLEGRASRKTWWLAILTALLVVALLASGFYSLLKIATESTASLVFWFLDVGFDFFALLVAPFFVVLLYWCPIALTVRRLHDCDMSGWVVFAGAIPLFGPIYLLIVCGFQKGNPSDNRYGPPPAAAENR